MPHCHPYDPANPLPNSVLIMDNASIQKSAEVRALCDEFGVGLEFLPPYSADYNLIEESFAEFHLNNRSSPPCLLCWQASLR